MGLLTNHLKTVSLADLLGPKLAEFEADFDRLEVENRGLQAKLRATEAEFDRLKVGTRELQVKLHAAEGEIRYLKNLPPDQTPAPGELPSNMERILICLSGMEGATADAIGRQLRQGPEKTRLKLAELQKSGFVWQKGFHDREPEWRIGQNGRKYLADRQLAA